MPVEIWFEKKELTPDELLEQGDFLLSCSFPVVEGYAEDGEMNISIAEDVSAVVLTQSCDLANKKVENVVFGVCLSLDRYIQKRFESIKSEKIEKGAADNAELSHQIKGMIKQELVKMCRVEAINTFILPKIPSLDEMYIVNFDDIFSLPYGVAVKLFRNQKRIIRLKSPYRECLSQSFARSFMRVGLDERVSTDECQKTLDAFFINL